MSNVCVSKWEKLVGLGCPENATVSVSCVQGLAQGSPLISVSQAHFGLFSSSSRCLDWENLKISLFCYLLIEGVCLWRGGRVCVCTHKHIFLTKLFFAFVNWYAFIFVVFSCIFYSQSVSEKLMQIFCFYFLPLSTQLCMFMEFIFLSLTSFNLYMF